jgi:hypothetical protein
LIFESLINLASWGFGLTQVDVKKIVKGYLDSAEPGKTHTVSKNWLRGFMKRFRHQLSLRKATNVPAKRAQAMTKQCVDDFFDLVEEIYNKYGLNLKPHNIWNCDETGFACDQGNLKVICAKGQYNPCKIQGNH